MKHGQNKQDRTRCDECTEKHEAEEKRIRLDNYKKVMNSSDQLSCDFSKSKPMVLICCSECGSGKEIDMNMFWRNTNDRNRFQNISCKDCKNIKRLSKWQRRPHETHNSIENWLTHNNAYKSSERHATLTVDLCFTQDIAAETSLKRSLPVAATPKSCKHQKT